MGTGGSGTVTKSNDNVHGGSFSGKHYSLLSLDQAYAYTDFTRFSADHHYSVWFNMTAYTGTNGDLIAELYDAGGTAKVTILATVKYYAANTTYYIQVYEAAVAKNIVSISSNTWYHFEGYYNATSGKVHYYLDNIKQGNDWSSYSGAAVQISRNYIGDTSTTAGVNNGWLYFDDMLLDTAVEPTSIPTNVAGTYGTNTTLKDTNWLFHSQWYTETGTLSGFKFCDNQSGSPVNDTWTAFSETNNSWANVTHSISNALGTDIQWGIYANSSDNVWNVIVWQNAFVTVQLTFYNDGGGAGSVKCNGTTMTNGTTYTFTTAVSIANLAALPNNMSSFVNFTWTVGISGSTTINDYNLTIYNATTVWCYFAPLCSYIQASFTWTPSNPVISEWVTFDASASASSGTIANYTWQFEAGDSWTSGISSTIQHFYSSNATFEISLIVGGSVGNSSMLTLALVVGWGANHTEQTWILAAFNWSAYNPAINEQINFTSCSNSSSAISSYSWNFGDGNTTAGAYVSILHSYPVNATFELNLTVTSTAGSSWILESITIGWGSNHTCPGVFTYAIARFEFFPSNPENATLILFNGSQSYYTDPISDYSWNFGDGNTTSSGAQDWIRHVYGTDGSYDVSLTVTASVSNMSAVTFRQVNVTSTIGGGGLSRTMPEDLASWVVGGFIGVLVLIAVVLIVRRRH